MKKLKFEWDEEKERKNIKAHKIDFTTAAHVFADEYRIEKYDEKHSVAEDRYIVIGAIDGYLAVVVVSYTVREKGIIRLISARAALEHERKEYYGYY